MNQPLCTRCRENVAIVYVTKIANNERTNEGYCLRCARELNIGPVGEIFKRLEINEDEVDNLTNDMMELMRDPAQIFNGLMPGGEEDDDEDGKTATFPFLDRIFNNLRPMDEKNNELPARPARDPAAREQPREAADAGRRKTKFLDNYCISLSKRAQEGKIDRVVGRGGEIERVVQIINRRQKNNPCLIGEPGVGKTAIAEGLALRIAEGQAPAKLLQKEIYLLDLTALVAGTQFRGQFESRMKGLIEEIKKIGNIILVIDEVHTLVGAGDAEGSMNAANILKPALSRGEIQVIGATTFAEYRKHIEKDAALERRFQPIVVNEPSIEESVTIIEGIARYYEQHHGVQIPPDICRKAVVLSERYITDRYLPDKAIDLIDESASYLNLHSPVINEAAKVRAEIDALRAEEQQWLEKNDYESLANCRIQQARATERLGEIMKNGAPVLGIEDLARVIEQWTKIPASSIAAAEFERLRLLPDRLKARIVGQDPAIAAVSAAIARNRVGLSPKRKPVSFIFAGPTGVGKTELVKQLAQDLFDAPECLVRLDMSEFMEKHSVSRIIGSPPGYVGYDDAGQLTEKIRRKPYSVVLFDEIEKAHADVLNILLQILDDGHISDAHGRKINFENTVIIMTTNAGSEKQSTAIGFGHTTADQSKEKTMKALKDFLRPEFLNRVDEVVIFAPLTQEHFKDIAAIMLRDLQKSMAEGGFNLIFDDSLTEYVVKKSYSNVYGARNLHRLLQKELEDAIAGLLVDRHSEGISQLKAASDGEQVVITAL